MLLTNDLNFYFQELKPMCVKTKPSKTQEKEARDETSNELM